MDNNCMIIIDSNYTFEDQEEDYDIGGYMYLECQYNPDIGVFFDEKLVFKNDEILQFYKKDKYYEEEYKIAHHKIHPYYRFLENSINGVKWYEIHCVDSIKAWEKPIFPANMLLEKKDGFILYKGGKECTYTGYHIFDIEIRKEIYIKKAKQIFLEK